MTCLSLYPADLHEHAVRLIATIVPTTQAGEPRGGRRYIGYRFRCNGKDESPQS